jgi:3-oxoacyl-[acyl-carrier protein] reductase
MIPINLSGKTAIITGAGQGLGAATAAILGEAGANVVVNYFADPEGLNRQRAEQTATGIGSNAVAIEADVRDTQALTAMFEAAIERFGSVDIVVNNAGILRDKTLKKMSDDEWQSVIDTNLTGVFKVCRIAAEKLADNGRIVNFSSIAGFVGFFGQANYASAKAGVAAMTKVLSKEVSRRNITVNAVAPGVILTEMGKTIPEEVQKIMLQNIPLERFGEVDEIAGVVLFLCSDLSSYMTGQILHVNGGWI